MENSTILPEEVKVFYRELLESPKHTLMSMYGGESDNTHVATNNSPNKHTERVAEHTISDNNSEAKPSETNTSDNTEEKQPFKLPTNLSYKLSPMTRYILDHPFADIHDLDCEAFNSLIKKHACDRTPEGITPFMVAIIINNEAYFERLFRFGLFLQDRFATSNLEFAYMSNASENIIKLLEFYETCYEWQPKRY